MEKKDYLNEFMHFDNKKSREKTFFRVSSLDYKLLILRS